MLSAELKKQINSIPGTKGCDAHLCDGINDVVKSCFHIWVGENVDNFVHPKIITNTGNRYPRGWKRTELEKHTGWAYYQGEPVNKFFHNGSFGLSFKTVSRPRIVMQRRQKNALIVGSGPSWELIKNKDLRSSFDVWVVNYNFNLKATFNVIRDKKVVDDFKGVVFPDDRVVIGEKTHDYGNVLYESSYHHTGADTLQMAHDLGYEKVYLIGYDYRPNKDGSWHSYKTQNFYTDKKVSLFLSDFERMYFDNVYNLNSRSRLEKFKTAIMSMI